MSKCSKIREAWASGDRIAALRIAARFFDRSEATQIFKRGMNAFNNPEFYRQLRQDPDQITTAALHLLARKFNLTPRQFHNRPQGLFVIGTLYGQSYCTSCASSLGHPTQRFLVTVRPANAELRLRIVDHGLPRQRRRCCLGCSRMMLWECPLIRSA